MNPYVNLKHLGAELQCGETRAGVQCPFCGGGQTHERSLSIARPDEATCLYICHRASCGRKGRVACWGFRLSESDPSRGYTAPTPKAREVYNGVVRHVGSQWLSDLYKRFGLEPSDLHRAGWGEDARTTELVIPILNRYQVRSGTYLRQPYSSGIVGRRKVRHYFTDDSPRQSWQIPSSRSASSMEVVVVEDPISAFKVCLAGFPSVAILGTHLDVDRISDIKCVCSRMLLCLDADATDKSFYYQKAFGLYLDIRVGKLERDLKYEALERIKEIVSHVPR